MKGLVLSALCFAAAALFGAGCVTANPVPPLTGPDPSAAAVSAVLQTYPDRQPHDLTQDRGHVVIVDVWATWCEPCRDALPLWQDVQKQYGPQGLRIYALSMDEDPNQIGKFIQQTRLSIPVLLDENEDVVGPILKVNVMPTTFLLDRHGKIRFVHEGFSEEELAKYQAEIELLLAEKD